MFFGQGGDSALAYMAEGADGVAAAEERLKSYALGDPGERGLARRRVVRRPLGSGYQAQAIVLSERDGAGQGGAGLSSTEPLSDLLMQLTSSRSKAGQSWSGRAAASQRDGAGTSVLSSLTGLSAAADSRRTSDAAASPAQQLRASFVQELMLSALSQPISALDSGPLDAAPASSATAERAAS